jgi:hypothetical protein
MEWDGFFNATLQYYSFPIFPRLTTVPVSIRIGADFGLSLFEINF